MGNISRKQIYQEMGPRRIGLSRYPCFYPSLSNRCIKKIRPTWREIPSDAFVVRSQSCHQLGMSRWHIHVSFLKVCFQQGILKNTLDIDSWSKHTKSSPCWMICALAIDFAITSREFTFSPPPTNKFPKSPPQTILSSISHEGRFTHLESTHYPKEVSKRTFHP